MVRRVHNGRSGSLVAHHEFLRDPRIDGDISVQFIPEAFPVRFGLPLGDRFAEGDILRPERFDGVEDYQACLGSTCQLGSVPNRGLR